MFGQQLNRIPPVMGPEMYKSYAMRAPLGTHWRKASCEEFECDEYVHGFVLTIDMTTELGQRQMDYIKKDKTRKCSLQKVGDTLWKAIYGPGNRGFASDYHDGHRVPIGRPPFLLVYDGDWRGNPRGTEPLRHVRMEDWIDDFATHQDKIATAHQRG